jgi:hypothetical protein
MSNFAGMRGKLPAQPSLTVDLFHYLKYPLPAPPKSYDYGNRVKNYPMAANDQYGDCTIAGVIHMLQLAYVEVGEVFHYPGDQAVIDTYLRLSGGVDSGLVIANVLKEWMTNGLFGTKIAGWAPVNIHNWDQMKTAAYAFGGLYVGVEMPAEAEQQFEAGQNWHIDEHTGTPVGGHCVTISGFNSFGADIQTWGAETACTQNWWKTFGSEDYVVIPEIFVEKKHGPLANFDVTKLQADLKDLA